MTFDGPWVSHRLENVQRDLFQGGTTLIPNAKHDRGKLAAQGQEESKTTHSHCNVATSVTFYF